MLLAALFPSFVRGRREASFHSFHPRVEDETKRPREGLKPPSRRAWTFHTAKRLGFCLRCGSRHRVSAFQSFRFMKRLLKRAPTTVSLVSGAFETKVPSLGVIGLDGFLPLLGKLQTGSPLLDQFLLFQVFGDAVHLCLQDFAFGAEPAEVSGNIGL